MKFSIITCTRNSARYLQGNIDSVKSQTFKDFEHIFIDGFSIDGTTELIRKYQSEFPDKVRLFQFEPKGISNAMNHGINEAKGDYLIHLHSDDSFYGPDVLEEVSLSIEKENRPEMLHGLAKFINSENKRSRLIPHRKIYQKLRFWLLLLTNYIPHQSVFLKREVFERYGLFDEAFRSSMDYDMWLRLSKNKIRSVFLKKVICNFSVRKDAQSAKGLGASERLKSIEKHITNKALIGILSLVGKLNRKRSFF